MQCLDNSNLNVGKYQRGRLSTALLIVHICDVAPQGLAFTVSVQSVNNPSLLRNRRCIEDGKGNVRGGHFKPGGDDMPV